MTVPSYLEAAETTNRDDSAPEATAHNVGEGLQGRPPRSGRRGLEEGGRVGAPEVNDRAEPDQPAEQSVETGQAKPGKPETAQVVEGAEGKKHGTGDPGPVPAAQAKPGQPEPQAGADQADHDKDAHQGTHDFVELAGGGRHGALRGDGVGAAPRGEAGDHSDKAQRRSGVH